VKIALPGPGEYGVGMVFLPSHPMERYKCEVLFEDIVATEGLHLLGWRTVPTEHSSLGQTAIASEPVVRQVFIARPGELGDDLAFERKLYVIRRLAERGIRASGIHVLSDKIDIATARLEFKSGCVATLTASRVHQGKVRKLRIFEPTVYYSVDYIDQEVKVFPLDRSKTDIKTLRIPKEEPLKKELKSFLDCLRLGKCSKVSGEEGLRALRLAYSVLKEAAAV
jgi:hypothetical protein